MKSPMIGKVSRHGFAFCTVGTDIYVIGGCDGESIIDSCERYDTVGNAWKSIAPMS